MNVIQSSLEFHGYKVLKACYVSKITDVDSGIEINLNPTFSRAIRDLGNDEYSLKLGVYIGSKDDESKIPFFVEVEIEGKFLIKSNEDIYPIIKMNAVAIMFPYLRSTLSILSTLMNIDPIVLPVINLVKMFENEENGKQE